MQRLAIVGFAGERRTTVVLRSGYHYRVGSAAQDATLVEQQVPVERSLERTCHTLHTALLLRRGSLHIVGVVVVAKHGEYAVNRMQMNQRGRMTHQLLRAHVLQVAGEEDGIGMQLVHLCHHALSKLLLHRAEVHIRELHDAIAVEGFRQTVELERNALHVQLVGTHHRTHEQHIEPSEHKHQSGVVAPVGAQLQQSLNSQSGERRQGEDHLRHDEQPEHEQIHVEEREVIGRKVAHHRIGCGTGYHGGSRHPPQQTHP